MSVREIMVKENCGMKPANRSEERRTGACRSFLLVESEKPVATIRRCRRQHRHLVFRPSCRHQRQRLP